ncbi:MAG: tyrosine-type recombinase/integrase [Eubacterium sp.]|nr:tyrosine-type recombinase/integrase [Eubacterium sp.]
MKNNGGTVRQLKNGKYLWVGYFKDKEGKVHRPNRLFSTKEEAEDYRYHMLALYQEEQSERIAIRNKQLTFSQYYNFFEEKYFSDNETYSYSTIRDWRSRYNKYVKDTIGNQLIDNLVFQPLENKLIPMEITESTVSNITGFIVSALSKAVDNNFITDKELQNYKYELKQLVKRLNKPSKQSDYAVYNVLTQDDYFAIITLLKERNSYYLNAIEFLRETGIRASEIAIKHSDIKIIRDKEDPTKNKGYAKIRRAISKQKGKPKTVTNYLKSAASHRTVSLNTYAIEAIDRQIQYKKKHNINSDYIFTSKKGKLVDTRNILRAFHKAIERINNSDNDYWIEKVGLHSLRKLYCYTLIRSGADIMDVSKSLGHSELETTKKYYYAYDQDSALGLAEHSNLNDERIIQKRKELGLL